ncbi:MAG: hypothetical protein IPO28_07525 [Holophagaceae bacterium]|nr:hypothetical protein [Holophagaceae bacterium]
MRLSTPGGFATEVFLLEAPDRELLPVGAWTLVGDLRLREAWAQAGMPEPEHACGWRCRRRRRSCAR